MPDIVLDYGYLFGKIAMNEKGDIRGRIVGFRMHTDGSVGVYILPKGGWMLKADLEDVRITEE